MTAATATEEDDTETETMTTTRPLSMGMNLDENAANERETETQQDSNRDDRAAGDATMIPMSSSRESERSGGEYSFVNVSGALCPAETSTEETQSPIVPTTSMQVGSPGTPPSATTTQAVAAPEAEACDSETDAVIINTLQDNSSQSATLVSEERLEDELTEQTATVGERVEEQCSDDAVIRKILQEDLIATGRSTEQLQEYIQTASLEDFDAVQNHIRRASLESIPDINNEQSTAVASVARLDNNFVEAATVVGTVDECSDDAVIRKILQEDLIASGRSTDELQEYIRTASLEHVASRMNRSEEEKTEVVEPDSALAWAFHEQELSGSNLQSTVPSEEATVVRITEHDVHPAEVASSDARAELIGEDYSLSYAMSPSASAIPTDEGAVTTVSAIDEEAATEAMVLDSKPAAVPNPWETTEEATVLATSPPAEGTWSRANDEPGEVTVDAVVEDEALVVDITEDVHPAEFQESDVQATFIGRDYTSTVEVDGQEVAVGETGEEEALVMEITEDVHPADLERNEAQATFVGSTKAVSFSTPPASRPPTTARAVSDPPRNPVSSPVDSTTSSTFHPGIAALDAMEQHTWMDPPSSFTAGDEVIPPPGCQAPAPMAAAQVMDEDAGSDNCSDVPPLPSRSSVAVREPRTSSTRTEESERSSGTTGSGRRAAASLQLFSTAAVRGTNSMMRSTSSLMDVLFGESRQPQHGFDLDAATGSILPRTLLPWSVFPKPSGMWVATVNTNQKALDSNNVKEASKALRAFSCATQMQAEALARAWAPPRMRPFSDNPVCFICESKFAVFRRACHCRNCGVCVCSNCIVQWPAKMLPETYNIKRENLMNVCKSCDWLCSTLRLALLNGQHDQAVAVHATGNVNLVTPFANVKGELFYPVHCAVLGESLSLLKWLVDDHCCPLRSLRVGGRRHSRGTYTPILTSRGRSCLGIAMENRSLEIVRYLVADKNMSLTEEKGLTLEKTIQTLEAALRRLPSESDGTIPQQSDNNATDFIPTQIPPEEMSPTGTPATLSFSLSPQESSPASANGSPQNETRSGEAARVRDDASSGSVEDACIICFANTIDCVVTPCGHQICCMQCSTHISRCPVCSVECSFMRVFKP